MKKAYIAIVSIVLAGLYFTGYLSPKLTSSDLFEAAKAGDFKIVKRAVESGVDSLQKNKEGSTVLHKAIVSDDVQIAKFIIDKTPKIIAVKDGAGLTPLHLASKYNRLSLVKLIISKDKKTVLSTDMYEKTPLHYALEGAYFDVAELIINTNKETVVKKDDDGETALHIASLSGDMDLVQLIVTADKNTIFKQNNVGNTPLHNASIAGRLDIFELLLQTSLDKELKEKEYITFKNLGGKNALEYSVDFQELPLAKMLLKTKPVSRTLMLTDGLIKRCSKDQRLIKGSKACTQLKIKRSSLKGKTAL